MFDIRVTEEGGFEIVTDDPYDPYLPPVLRGFYSGIYKKHVINEMVRPWWFSADELREVAGLLDYYDYPGEVG